MFVDDIYIVVSSAKRIALEVVRLFGRSLVYKINNKGPRMLPCGTPQGTICVDDLIFLYCIYCFRFLNNY